MDTIEIKGEVFFVDSLCEDNLTDLISMYKEVFGVVYTLEAIRKKYNTDYLGVSYFGHFARNQDNKAIAFHGAIPYRVSYNGQVELAAQYGDAMTIKNYAGNGFFTLLGKRTDEQLRTRGIRFVYGFPNQNSEYGYLNKMDWAFKYRMNRYKFEVGSIPVEAISRKTGLLKGSYRNWAFEKLEKLKSQQKSMINSATQEGRLSTFRDEAYYEYKSFTDNMILELKSGLAWIKLDSGLLVGDVSINAGASAEEMISELKEICRKLGLSSIIFQWYPNTEIDLAFTKLAIPHPSWIVGYCNFNSKLPVEEIVLTYGDLDTF